MELEGQLEVYGVVQNLEAGVAPCPTTMALSPFSPLLLLWEQDRGPEEELDIDLTTTGTEGSMDSNKNLSSSQSCQH